MNSANVISRRINVPRSAFYLALLGVVASIGEGLMLAKIGLPQIQSLVWPQQNIVWLRTLQMLLNNHVFIWVFIFLGYPIFLAATWWVLFDFFKDICKTDTSFPYEETIPWKKKLLAGLSILPPMAWFFASDRWLLGKRGTRSTLSDMWCAAFLGVLGVLVYSGYDISGKETVKLYWFASHIFSLDKEYSASFYFFFIGTTALFDGLSVFCVAALAYSLAPCQLVLRERVRRGIPFAVSLLGLLVLGIGVDALYHHYGMNGSGFAETLNLPNRKPEIKSVLMLDSDKNGIPRVTLQSLPIEVQLVRYAAIENVPATSSNLISIESYIRNNHRAFYLKDAYDVEALGYYANWDVTNGAHWLQAAAMGGGSLISRMLAVALLAMDPTTPENKAYVEKWADESVWWHGVTTCTKLARIYAFYGDLTRAHYFEEKAVKLQSTNQRDTRYTVADIHHDCTIRPGTFTDGCIEGRLALGAGVTAPERVGLFYLAPVGIVPFRKPNMGGPVIFSTLFSLRDAKVIGKDLQFSFRNVRNGVYCIVFMFDADTLPPSSKIVIKNNPGSFQIDRQKPVEDLRIISISRT